MVFSSLRQSVGLSPTKRQAKGTTSTPIPTPTPIPAPELICYLDTPTKSQSGNDAEAGTVPRQLQEEDEEEEKVQEKKQEIYGHLVMLDEEEEYRYPMTKVRTTMGR